MEGKTHYERIINGTQADKEKAMKELQAEFEEQDEELAAHEIEKTPEDLEIIHKTESIVDKLVARYGGNPQALPLDNIYVLKPGSVSEMTKGKLAGGIYKPMGLKIGAEKKRSRLLFASTVAHELFHLKSYKSARIGKSADDIHLYRSGLAMIDRKDPDEEAGKGKEYFGLLEEAIVAECTRRFIDEISKESMFREEMEAVGRFRNWVVAYYRRLGVSEEKIREFERELKYVSEPQEKVAQVLSYSSKEEKREAYAAGMFQALYEDGEAEIMERYHERKKLYELLDKVVAGSGGRYKDRDEIFDEFAKANFSGHYLPLARIIESILGKKEFRKLAEEFSQKPAEEEPDS